MRDPKRIELMLNLLQEAWCKSPELRLTQLMINVANTSCDCSSVFYMEDDVFEGKLKKMINSL